jgi:cell volume regulation protein A
VGLIAWIQQPAYDLHNLILLVMQQIGLGVLVGVLLGALATRVFARLPPSLGSFSPVASLAACMLSYGAAAVIGGSGFLAVYLVGLAIGSTPSRYRHHLVAFHEGIAFLAQVILFVALGLLVFPHQLIPVAAASLVLAVLLITVIRPLAVWLSIPIGYFTTRERALLGFAGLRGAVPIVLGTFVLSSGIAHRGTIFNAVFFVVLASALIQGATLERFARWLGVVEKPALPVGEQFAKITADSKINAKISFIVEASHAIAGARVKEVGLPRRVQITTIKRDGKNLKPLPATELFVGDRLSITAPASLQPDLEDVMRRWRRRV